MGKLTFIETPIKDLLVIEPKVFGDNRGYFLETYNQNDFIEAGLNLKFVQDNESRSIKGTLRGMHFQKNHPQGKLVRAQSGEVFDAVVDIRKGSETFGKWYGVHLSGENKKMLYVPEGFAHGFLVLSDYAVFVYKCTDFYHPEDEGALIWNDETVNINWPVTDTQVLLSAKDSAAQTFNEFLRKL